MSDAKNVTSEAEMVVSESEMSGSDPAFPMILDLRPVQASPAGTLFDHFPSELGQVRRQSFLRRHFLFILLVVVPTVFAIAYFGFIAASLYVTETKFIVRSAGGDTGGLSILTQGQGFSRAVDETYAVNEYLISRNIVPLLNKDGQLRKVYSRPESDFGSRFPGLFQQGTNEQFLKYLKNYISLSVDSSTGISTLQVAAFRPEDSMDISYKLIALGEEFINQLNSRANEDSLDFALSVRDAAFEKLKDVDRRISMFRNQELVIDPLQEASQAIDRLSKLSLQISQMEAHLAETEAQTPKSPAIVTQRERIKSVKDEYNRMHAELVGSNASLSVKLGRYQSLMLEKDLATRAMANAVVGVEQARQDAKSRRIYLQNIVDPKMPDQPTRPYRLLWILGIIGLSLCIFLLVKSFRDTVMEHQA